jgi:hypothetical protein
MPFEWTYQADPRDIGFRWTGGPQYDIEAMSERAPEQAVVPLRQSAIVLAEKGIQRPATTQLLPAGECNSPRRVPNAHRPVAATAPEFVDFYR